MAWRGAKSSLTEREEEGVSMAYISLGEAGPARRGVVTPVWGRGGTISSGPGGAWTTGSRYDFSVTDRLKGVISVLQGYRHQPVEECNTNINTPDISKPHAASLWRFTQNGPSSLVT